MRCSPRSARRAIPLSAEKARDFGLSIRNVQVGELYNVYEAQTDEPENRAAVWQWLQGHYAAYRERLPAFRRGYMPKTFADGRCSADEADQLSAFFAPRIKDLVGGDRGLGQTLETIRQCASLREHVGARGSPPGSRRTRTMRPRRSASRTAPAEKAGPGSSDRLTDRAGAARAKPAAIVGTCRRKLAKMQRNVWRARHGDGRAPSVAEAFSRIPERNTGDAMLRTAQQHHVVLSSMADTKANIIITVSSIVLTLSLGRIGDAVAAARGADAGGVHADLAVLRDPRGVAQASFACASAPARFPKDFNLLFFGHFADLSRERFLREIAAAMKPGLGLRDDGERSLLDRLVPRAPQIPLSALQLPVFPRRLRARLRGAGLDAVRALNPASTACCVADVGGIALAIP